MLLSRPCRSDYFLWPQNKNQPAFFYDLRLRIASLYRHTLFIQLNNHPIVGVLSYGNQVNIKLTKKGVGKITIREVKASGLLPITISPPELIELHNQSLTMKDGKSKLKKKCCKKYKKGKQCLTCPTHRGIVRRSKDGTLRSGICSLLGHP